MIAWLQHERSVGLNAPGGPLLGDYRRRRRTPTPPDDDDALADALGDRGR